jgi:hypothetical protein
MALSYLDETNETSLIDDSRNHGNNSNAYPPEVVNESAAVQPLINTMVNLRIDPQQLFLLGGVIENPFHSWQVSLRNKLSSTPVIRSNRNDLSLYNASASDSRYYLLKNVPQLVANILQGLKYKGSSSNPTTHISVLTTIPDGSCVHQSLLLGLQNYIKGQCIRKELLARIRTDSNFSNLSNIHSTDNLQYFVPTHQELKAVFTGIVDKITYPCINNNQKLGWMNEYLTILFHGKDNIQYHVDEAYSHLISTMNLLQSSFRPQEAYKLAVRANLYLPLIAYFTGITICNITIAPIQHHPVSIEIYPGECLSTEAFNFLNIESDKLSSAMNIKKLIPPDLLPQLENKPMLITVSTANNQYSHMISVLQGSSEHPLLSLHNYVHQNNIMSEDESSVPIASFNSNIINNNTIDQIIRKGSIKIGNIQCTCSISDEYFALMGAMVKQNVKDHPHADNNNTITMDHLIQKRNHRCFAKFNLAAEDVIISRVAQRMTSISDAPIHSNPCSCTGHSIFNTCSCNTNVVNLNSSPPATRRHPIRIDSYSKAPSILVCHKEPQSLSIEQLRAHINTNSYPPVINNNESINNNNNNNSSNNINGNSNGSNNTNNNSNNSNNNGSDNSNNHRSQRVSRSNNIRARLSTDTSKLALIDYLRDDRFMGLLSNIFNDPSYKAFRTRLANIKIANVWTGAILSATSNILIQALECMSCFVTGSDEEILTSKFALMLVPSLCLFKDKSKAIHMKPLDRMHKFCNNVDDAIVVITEFVEGMCAMPFGEQDRPANASSSSNQVQESNIDPVNGTDEHRRKKLEQAAPKIVHSVRSGAISRAMQLLQRVYEDDPRREDIRVIIEALKKLHPEEHVPRDEYSVPTIINGNSNDRVIIDLAEAADSLKQAGDTISITLSSILSGLAKRLSHDCIKAEEYALKADNSVYLLQHAHTFAFDEWVQSLEDKDLIQHLLHLPTGAAPGPYLPHTDFIHALIKKEQRESSNINCRLASALNLQLRHIMNGTASPTVYSIINQSKLIGIPKDDGKVRPIAVGNMFNKWAARCYISAFSSQLDNEFHDSPQLGARVKDGISIIALMHKTVKEAKPGWVSFNFDMSNAFNSVRRDKIFEAVIRATPAALPMIARLLYHDSELWVAGAQNLSSSELEAYIMSKEGCRQGDALSPLLFCLAINMALRELRVKARLDKTILVAYMDDISGRGPYDEVCRVIEHIRGVFEPLGLSLNMKKTVIYETEEASAEIDRLLNEVYTPDTPRYPSAPDIIRPTTDEGYVAVGTPIGSANYIENWLSKTVTSFQHRSTSVVDFGRIDPQVGITFTTYCLANQLRHLTRTLTPTPPIRHLFNLVDKTLQDTVLGVISEGDRSIDASAECTLRARDIINMHHLNGGMSIPSMNNIFDAAHVGTLLARIRYIYQTLERCEDVDTPHHHRLPKLSDVLTHQHDHHFVRNVAHSFIQRLQQLPSFQHTFTELTWRQWKLQQSRESSENVNVNPGFFEGDLINAVRLALCDCNNKFNKTQSLLSHASQQNYDKRILSKYINRANVPGQHRIAKEAWANNEEESDHSVVLRLHGCSGQGSQMVIDTGVRKGFHASSRSGDLSKQTNGILPRNVQNFLYRSRLGLPIGALFWNYLPPTCITPNDGIPQFQRPPCNCTKKCNRKIDPHIMHVMAKDVATRTSTHHCMVKHLLLLCRRAGLSAGYEKHIFQQLPDNLSRERNKKIDLYVKGFPASKLRTMFSYYPGRTKRPCELGIAAEGTVATQPGAAANATVPNSSIYPVHQYINQSLDKLDTIIAENPNAVVHLAADLTTALPQAQVDNIKPSLLHDAHAVSKLRDSFKFSHYSVGADALTFPTFVLPLTMSTYGCYSYLTEKFVDHLLIKDLSNNYIAENGRNDLNNYDDSPNSRREVSYRRNAWNNISRIFFNRWYQGLLYNPWRYNSRNARNYSDSSDILE